MAPERSKSGALALGGLAALLASTCCVPIALGFSGAWIGNPTVFETYRSLFIGVALVSLFFAWRRIYRHSGRCLPGEICALPRVKRLYKTLFWVVVALVLIALSLPYVAPLFY